MNPPEAAPKLCAGAAATEQASEAAGVAGDMSPRPQSHALFPNVSASWHLRGRQSKPLGKTLSEMEVAAPTQNRFPPPLRGVTDMTPEEKKRLASAVRFWFHSFNFGDGALAKGYKSSEILESEWKKLQLPPLCGKSVLDVNTWDGWFAMEAEKANASRVVALDSYVWRIDIVEHWEYLNKCSADKVHPRPFHEMPYFKPDELPGKIGFDTAKRVTGSRIEEVVGDFATMHLVPLGQFDVVLYLGTLYHMMDPIGSHVS